MKTKVLENLRCLRHKLLLRNVIFKQLWSRQSNYGRILKKKAKYHGLNLDLGKCMLLTGNTVITEMATSQIISRGQLGMFNMLQWTLKNRKRRNVVLWGKIFHES